MKDKLMTVLNSDEFYKVIYNKAEFLESIDALNVPEDFNDIDVLIKYYKAYALYLLDHQQTEEGKKEVVHYFECGVFAHYFSEFLHVLSTANADVNDVVENHDEYFDMLSSYDGDPLFEELSEHDSELAKMVSEQVGYIPINDLKAGNYKCALQDDYKFSDEEIEKIKKVKSMPIMSSLYYSLYGELYKGVIAPNFENSNIKLPIYTGRKDQEFEILFEDGTIVYYINGYIRVRCMNFYDVLSFVKLSFIQNYREGVLEGDYDGNEFNDGIDFNDANFKYLLQDSFDFIYGFIIELDERYSKKMIYEAKKKYDELENIVRVNKLL